MSYLKINQINSTADSGRRARQALLGFLTLADWNGSIAAWTGLRKDEVSYHARKAYANAAWIDDAEADRLISSAELTWIRWADPPA